MPKKSSEKVYWKGKALSKGSESKKFASSGRKALGKHIRSGGSKSSQFVGVDRLHRRQAGHLADYVTSKTDRLRLGEKIRGKAKKAK